MKLKFRTMGGVTGMTVLILNAAMFHEVIQVIPQDDFTVYVYFVDGSIKLQSSWIDQRVIRESFAARPAFHVRS